MKKILALTLTLVVTIGANSGAWAAWSASGTGTATASAGSLAQPAAPSATRTSEAPTTVDLSWDAVQGATSYEVHRFSTATATATTGNTYVCSGTTNCSDTTATTGSNYWYRLIAQRNNWTSQISEAVSVPADADTTGPTITVTDPSANDSYKKGAWPGAFSVTVVPTGSSVRSVEVALRSTSGSTGGNCWPTSGAGFTVSCSEPSVFRSATYSSETGSWQLSYDAFVNGNQDYEAVIRATDLAGNVTTTSHIAFSVHGS